MSLYRFTESFMETNPDLGKINIDNIYFDDLYNYYRNNEKRFPIQIYLDSLFYDILTRNSESIEEFRELKFKTTKIAQAAQKLYILSLLNDKLEKEKYETLLKEKINKI
jgi:hypothetical protein